MQIYGISLLLTNTKEIKKFDNFLKGQVKDS